MRDLNDLHLFVAVVANGGFSAAARALGIPKSRISRRVAALEEDLGVRLVERSTRRFKVTEVGQDVYGHARAAISETEAIDEAVARLKAEPQGLVRVSCPLDTERMLATALPTLLTRYPRLRVQFLVTNRRVDIIEEGIDIAVRVRERLDTDADLQMKQLGHSVQQLVASPGFIAAHGALAHPRDIPSLPTLAHSERAGPERWTLVNATGEEIVVTHEPRLAASAFPLLREAACAGMGIALLPDAACAEALGDGRLEQLLPEWTGRRGIVHLVFTSRRGLLPSVRTVLDFLAEALDPRAPAWTRLGSV